MAVRSVFPSVISTSGQKLLPSRLTSGVSRPPTLIVTVRDKSGKDALSESSRTDWTRG